MTTTADPISASSPTHVADDDRLVFTVAEAGELLGISRAFAYELVARGELPVIRLGRRRLVPKVALLALVGAGGSPLAADPGSAMDSGDHA
jgi:excisionase family DNA binding protein